jgi:hypothetical protein
LPIARRKGGTASPGWLKVFERGSRASKRRRAGRETARAGAGREKKIVVRHIYEIGSSRNL